MGNLQIAIDGPAGSGKSTVAKRVADRLGILYIDTGAMYRALTYKAVNSGISPENTEAILLLAHNTHITFEKGKVYLDGEDVTQGIRTALVDKNVSKVAEIAKVRELMVKMQRQMAEDQGVVMDGRDIGTFVLPQAGFKFFLTASIEERAERRYREMLQTNSEVDLRRVKEDILRRDKLDSCRQFAPLKRAEDAVLIDTTEKSVDQVVDEILCIVRGKGDAV